MATARLYGDVVEELALPGSHLAVCMRCLTGNATEFNERLSRHLHRVDALFSTPARKCDGRQGKARLFTASMGRPGEEQPESEPSVEQPESEPCQLAWEALMAATPESAFF